MAATATDIWEFRATAGSANAGGGYDSSAGTTDYSNQDSAQLQLTDLATSGIGVTTLTSATGGFTAAMVGNYIQIRSGTNVTAGFYRVTAHTDTNTVTLDRAPDDGVGGIGGGSGDLGGALDVITDAFIDDANIVIAGNIIYIKNENMTLTGAISGFKDASTLLPIEIHGYNTTRGDCPTGANRPTIIGAGNLFSVDNFWIVKNLIVTATGTSGLEVGTDSVIDNCKVTNSSGSVNRSALRTASERGNAIRCEGISTNGRGLLAAGSTCTVFACYLHDSTDGISIGSRGNIINCVIDTCTNGILSTSFDDISVIGNTIYNCTTGISETDGHSWVVLNNILDANTTGASWTTEQKNNFFDFNIWDNTTDVTNVTKGQNAITGDPGLTDPANGDFTLTGGSNAIDTGLDAGDAGATV